MQTYLAHYTSPKHSESATGVFEYQSASRANTKKNPHDARMKMLETYGKDAVSWVIDSVELKKEKDVRADGQMELDFREAPKKKRPRKKEWWQGSPSCRPGERGGALEAFADAVDDVRSGVSLRQRNARVAAARDA